MAGDRGCDANITAKPYLGKGKDDDVESCYDRKLDVGVDRFMIGNWMMTTGDWMMMGDRIMMGDRMT